MKKLSKSVYNVLFQLIGVFIGKKYGKWKTKRSLNEGGQGYLFSRKY